MSAYGWCWRCAEQDLARLGVEQPGDEGPLCELCRADLEDVQVVEAPARPEGLAPEWYGPPVRVGRRFRVRAWEDV